MSIETQHISVGSRMQQFTLPNVILTLSEDNLRLKNTAGELVHLTINPLTPRTWNIAQNETQSFSQNFNYIYLKAEKVGSNAVFVVSEQKIMLDNDPIFYYFLVGSVSSVIDGVRRIKTNYGFTQISPNEITTGRLSSANGANWIDLLQDRIEINAKVSFAPNSPALTQVDNAIQSKMNGLGSLAWKDAVETAQLGETIVQGGYIKTDLLNASAIVSNGGGATSAELNNAINNINIGGRNLISNSLIWSYAPNNVIISAIKNIIKTKITNLDSISISRSDRLQKGFEAGVYTLSGRISVNGSIPKFDDFRMRKWVGVLFRSFNQSTGDFIVTQEFADNTAYPVDMPIYSNAKVGDEVTFINLKLEKGNKATDWTPAPEDLEAQFQNLQNGITNVQSSMNDVKTKTDNFTSIQGGLVSSNIISVGSTQVNQNAFISGITDAGGLSVRFGAGANYANKNNAPFRVLDNGKMIAENAHISGHIHATSGYIGSLEKGISITPDGGVVIGNAGIKRDGTNNYYLSRDFFMMSVGSSTGSSYVKINPFRIEVCKTDESGGQRRKKGYIIDEYGIHRIVDNGHTTILS